MNKVKIQIIHSCDLEVEIKTESSVYAPKGSVYFIPDKTNIFNFFAMHDEIIKERNKAIDKYDNVLMGLNYWKNKAEQK